MPTDSAARSYTVSEIAQLLTSTLRSNFPTLRVVGEISNFFRARSGHWYFRLKDAGAQIDCALFASDARGVGFQAADGMEVEVNGTLDYYGPNGKLQLKCRTMQQAGEGRLLAAFEALKRKLAAEGLFEASSKRALPVFPRGIGLVTSSDAAALRDILTTLERRWPMAPIYLMPVLVQGTQAAPQIVAALAHLPERAPEVDVIILARGGGSIEDLWAFNEEAVARAIRACRVPVISGVGHETDTTIADFAADLRAPTPTAAAERVAPDQLAVRQRLVGLHERLARATQQQHAALATRLDTLQRRSRRSAPVDRLQTHAQRVDELDARLLRAARARLRELSARLASGRGLLAAHHPGRRVLQQAPRELAQLRQRLRHLTEQQLGDHRSRQQHLQRRLRLSAPRARLRQLDDHHAQLRQRLQQAAQTTLRSREETLRFATASLRQLGPQSTLERGYAIAQDTSGRILRDADGVATGSTLRLQLAHGTLHTVVERTETGSSATAPMLDKTAKRKPS